MNHSMEIAYRGIRPQDKNGRNALQNPERGLRFEIGMGRIPSDPVKHGADHSKWPFDKFPDDCLTVAQGYCYLTSFWNCPISEEKLQAVQEDFDRIREYGKGMKFLLRFAYEFDGVKNGPTAEQIVLHMRQLKPILDRNWDIIYVIQTGWVGLWGEFHTSIEQIDKDTAKSSQIVDEMLKILPDDRFTMMRCMRYKKENLSRLNLFAEVNANTAFSQRPEAKIGFFNDGTLANYWDGGTFWDGPCYASAGNPEFDYIVREAPYIPVDGELFWSSQQIAEGWKDDPNKQFHGLDMTWCSGEKAIERFFLHHYSTFSYVHGFSGLETPVYGTIDAWKETPVTEEWLDSHHCPHSRDYFYQVESRTVFEYIRDHLGYRLEAQRIVYSDIVRNNSSFHAELSLVNFGFAAMINPRMCYFVLLHENGKMMIIPTAVNGQSFQPYSPEDKDRNPVIHKIEASSRIPDDFPKGSCNLCLWMPDMREPLHSRTDYCVRLANHIPWLEQNGYGLNVLGNVVVE